MRIAGEPHALLRYSCHSHSTDSPLHPFIRQIRRAAGLAHNDPSQERLGKLGRMLAQNSTSIEDAALLCEMLSLPNDGRYPALHSDPQERRRRTLLALVRQIEATARSTPLLMIFEDAHWIDPISLEMLGRAIDSIATLRVLLIVTFQPEFNAPWIGRSHVAAMTINRLTRDAVAAIIDRIAGDTPLPAGIQNDIIARTDGIPLFAEEMTKAVLEAKDEGVYRNWASSGQKYSVPASLHASLIARLDRLGPAKEVAQVGAAIGREFSHALIGAVMRESTVMEPALDRLIGAGLLFQQGVPPHATYLFKHALVQDAAYGTLLREPRRALHARIAEVLENEFPEVAASQPELLARHCTEAELIEKAASLWGKAGQQSLARSALTEATVQLGRALAQMEGLPGTPLLRREQIRLQVGLANALMNTKGHAALETKASLDQARALIEHAEAVGELSEDPLQLLSVLYGFWAANLVAFDGDELRRLSTQILGLADKQGEIAPRMIGHRLMGASLLLTGEIAQGRAHYDRALAMYDPVRHRELATRFGQDVGVAILSWRPMALWLLGYPDAALADAERALGAAREIGQAATLMYALTITPFAFLERGDFAAADSLSTEAIALADEKAAPFWRAFARLNQGRLFALTGRASDAVQIISGAISAWRSTGATLLMPLWLSCLANAHADLGQLEGARACISEAATAMEATREAWCAAEVHRIAGELELMLAEPSTPRAEACFERALITARRQGAKSWELRAAISMARLWRSRNMRQQAHDLLAPIFGWFTEGFATDDLKQARALLDELAA